MHKSHIELRHWIYLAMTGFALMNVALFLHPMSPEDFLGLAFSSPLLTILDSQGAGVALFFWVSLIAFGTGMGIVCAPIVSQIGHRLLPEMKPAINTLNKLSN